MREAGVAGRAKAIRIELARASDAEAVAAIARAAYAPYVPRIGREPAPMIADFPAQIATGVVWVAREGATVAGYLVIHDGPDSLHVENVAVARRGRGLGRRLLDFAEAEARRRGFARMDLYTNLMMRENLAIYPRLGWRETGRRREEGFDRVYFEKPVAAG